MAWPPPQTPRWRDPIQHRAYMRIVAGIAALPERRSTCEKRRR